MRQACRIGFARISLLLLSLTLAACQAGPPTEPLSKSQFLTFGTLVDLTIAGVSEERAAAAREQLERDFSGMNKEWHAWAPGPLGEVNRKIESGEWFTPPPSIMTLIERGSALSEASRHLFDPAIGRLIRAWGFQGADLEHWRPPDEQTIRRLVAQNPQMGDLERRGGQLRSRNPAVRLDFGGFAKGYGIEQAIHRLRKLGIDNAIVNAGGDLKAIGSRNGTPWTIGIRHPSGKGVLASLTTRDGESVFTSGDYERNFTWNGKRYHHIIDPRTGYPATGSRSVTVIAKDATLADAAATALFIAGPDQWHEIARRMKIRYVLLVDNQGRIHMNPAMQKRVRLIDPTGEVVISPPLDDPWNTGG